MRAIILYFTYKLHEEKLEAKKEGHSTWYHQRQHWISFKYMFGFFLGVVFSGFIISLIFQLALPLPPGFNELVQCMNLQRIPIILQGFSATLATSFAAFKIMKIRDSYSIKTELAIVSVVMPMLFVPWLVIEWLDLIPFAKYILILVAIALAHCTLILYPLYLTFVGRRLREKISMQNTEHNDGFVPQDVFEMCLTYEVLFAAFQQHCVESFCVENALFYRDCLLFLDMDEKHRKSELINLRTLYLKENARLLINILGKTRQTLLEQIEQGDVSDDLLHVAMREVSQQMYQDTFPKFKVSSRFKTAWKKAKMDKAMSVRSARSSKQSIKKDRSTSLVPLDQVEAGEAQE